MRLKGRYKDSSPLNIKDSKFYQRSRNEQRQKNVLGNVPQDVATTGSLKSSRCSLEPNLI